MIGTIEFQDVTETTVPDFKKFAEAAAAVKAKNPQITADRYAHVTARLQQDAAARFSAYLAAPPTENLTVRDRSVTDPDNMDVR